MSTTTAARIPLTYRLIFIFLDIALPTFGIIGNLFTPEANLSMYTPHPISPPNPETYVLLDCTSGFFAALLFLNVVFLLYRPNDLFVWKTLIGAMVFQDLFMVGGFLRELRVRGGEWSGQDYGNVGGYLAIAAVRGLFVLGVGLGGGRGGVKKES